MGLLGNELAFAQTLTPQEHEGVMALGHLKRYPADAHLLTEGDRSSHVVIIIRGWVTVSVATDRGATRLILGLRDRVNCWARWPRWTSIPAAPPCARWVP